MSSWMKALLTAMITASVLFTGPAFSKDLPSLEDGQVIMKWDDFEKILKELLKEEKKPEEEKPKIVPPRDYSLKGASFTIEIKDGFAQVQGEYALDVLADDKWVSVPVGGYNGGMSEVLVDGEPALIHDEGGRLSILLLGKGSRRVRASYAVAAPKDPGPNRFNVSTADFAGAMINLETPLELSDVSIQGAVIVETKEADKKRTIRAVIGGGSGLTVNYNVPVKEAGAAEAEKLPPKIYSEVEILVSIADEVVKANASFRFDVKHSPVSKFEMEVPKGYEVVNVIGNCVSNWKAEAGKLAINVGYEVKGTYVATVQLEAKREKASGVVTIPEPKTLGVERESGFVAVETRSSLEVEIDKTDGLLLIDATELPPGLGGSFVNPNVGGPTANAVWNDMGRARYPVLYAFRFGRHPYSGELSVTRHEEVEILSAAIDTANMVTLFTDDGKSVTRVIYEIRNNKRQYIKIDLPQGAEVWSAYLDQQPIKPARNAEGRLLLPLKKSGSDGSKVSFTVELIYMAPISKMEEKGKIETSYPKADIPASEMLVSLYLPDKFEYDEFEGDLDEERFWLGQFGVTSGANFVENGRVAQPASGIEALGYVNEEKAQGKKAKYSMRALNRQAELEREIADEIQMQQQAVNAPFDLSQVSDGQAVTSTRSGMLPVKFNVPLRGTVHRLSKLIVIDEAPALSFEFKKKKDPFPWSAVKKALWVLFVILIFAGLFYLVALIRRKSGQAKVALEKARAEYNASAAARAAQAPPPAAQPSEPPPLKGADDLGRGA